jgi:MazG family protein
MKQDPLPAIHNVLDVVAKLRDRNSGCPWDLKQTHHSLRPFMLEEAYEAVEAMSSEPLDVVHLKEELGDVLLQVLLNAQIADDNATFNFADICDVLADKLIRRHPHVFKDAVIDSPEAVVAQWDRIKLLEINAPAVKGVLIVSSVNNRRYHMPVRSVKRLFL